MTHPSLRRAVASILFAASLFPSGSVMAVTYLRGDASQVSNLNADAVTNGTLAWPRIEDITCPPGQYPNKVVRGRWICSAPTVTGLAAGTYGNAYIFNNRGNVFTGNGAALTNLNAANLTTGKIIWDRIADIACPTAGTVLTGFSGGKPVCATIGSGTVVSGGTGGVSGSGSANSIPLWTASGALGNSILIQNGNAVTVNGTLAASALSGSGANITALNAANITSGSVLWSRIADIACPTTGTVLTGFSGGRPVCVSLPSGTQTGGGTTSGGSVTSADQITSGMLSDARLSTNVVLRNGTQTFTGANTFSGTGNSFTGSGAGLTGLSASNISSGQLALARIANFACGQGQYLSGINNGSPSCATLPAAGGGGTTAGSGTANTLARWTSGTSIGTSLIQDNGSSIGVGGAPVAGQGLTVIGGTTGMAGYGSVYGIRGGSGSSYGVLGDGAGTAGVHGRGGVYGVEGTSAQAAGVRGTTTNVSGYGVQGINYGGGMGVYGEGEGAGLYGKSTSGYGVQGNSVAASGVVGYSRDIAGVFGNSDRGDGVRGTGGVYGVLGTTTNAAGVRGTNTNPSGSGVQGANSSGGYGVHGTSAGGVGVYGEGPGAGVSGASTNGYGVNGNSNNAAGVAGRSQASSGVSGSSVSGYGIVGSSDTGYSGYFTGGKGVYVTSPGSNTVALTVAGRIMTGDSTGYGGMYVDSGKSKFVGDDTRGNIGFYNGGNWGFVLDGSSIAHAKLAAAPASQTMCWLYDATAQATGNLSGIGYCSSSIKFKKNVKPLTLGMDVLRKLSPKTFDWKSDGSHDLGFIAEEVEKVDPILVEHDPDGAPLGVKYGQFSAVFVNALKEQDNRINALETENQALKTRLEKIEAALKLKK